MKKLICEYKSDRENERMVYELYKTLFSQGSLTEEIKVL